MVHGYLDRNSFCSICPLCLAVNTNYGDKLYSHDSGDIEAKIKQSLQKGLNNGQLSTMSVHLSECEPHRNQVGFQPSQNQ